MDIDLLSKMVKELILDNDRVILPGLGAFVAEMVPSTFSDKGYTINPPYRRMYFRSKPDEGTELAELYAKANNVDMALAERIIRDFVAELKSVLLARKAVALPGLGRLRATKENNVFFVADEDLNIYPAGFGLEPISLKTHQETQEEVAAAVGGLKSILVESQQDVKPQPVPVQEPMPEPKPEPKPEPLPEPEPIPAPASEPELPEEPAVAEEPVIEEEPEAEEGPSIEDGPEETVEEQPEEVEEEQDEDIEEDQDEDFEEETSAVRRKPNVKKVLLIVLGIIIALVLIAFAALAILGRTNPELIDRLLYTPEELKILNHTL